MTEQKYQQFLDDIVGAIQTLTEDELAELAAVLSTAETCVLGAIANNYPETVKITVDTQSGTA